MKAPRFLLVAALLTGVSGATDVRVQVTDPTLLTAVQDALRALSTAQDPYTLVNGQGPVFTLGGGATFSPDVASRSFGGANPRVEFNPEGPVPLADAVQGELRRLLGLKPADPTPSTGASTGGTSTTTTSSTGTPTSGASDGGTPTAATSTAGTSTDGTSTAGTSAASGGSTAGASSAGTSTAAVSTPPVKAGPADLNADGVVDPGDLAILMGSLGQTGKDLPADLNKDGRVDQRDIELFSKAYKLP